MSGQKPNYVPQPFVPLEPVLEAVDEPINENLPILQRNREVYRQAPGGAREGAGRVPDRVRYKGAITEAKEKIRDKLPEIVDSLLELARGIKVKEIGKDGKVYVYLRPPDRAACEYLMDRIMGKTPQKIALEDDDGNPLQGTITIIQPVLPSSQPKSGPDELLAGFDSAKIITVKAKTRELGVQEADNS